MISETAPTIFLKLGMKLGTLSLYNRFFALVQSSNLSPIFVPEPMVYESDHPSMPSESPDSQLNKRIHREEEAARLQNEVEVRLPVK